MQWLFLQLALRRRWARMGNCVDDGRCRTNKRPDSYRAFCLYYCRQRPTLPHSFPCSTIGGIRLNFRVRNGNGCDPDPMTTGKFAAWGLPPSLAVRALGDKPHAACPPQRRSAKVEVVPDNLFGRPFWGSARFKERLTTEYSANGSFSQPLTQRFPRALRCR